MSNKASSRSEVAHAPHDETEDTLLRSRIVEQLDDAACHIADDDTGNEQHDSAVKQSAKYHEQGHDGQGTGHCRHDDKQMASDCQAADGGRTAQQEQDDSNTKIGPRVDAQNGRSCQRIAESRLKQ